MPSPEDIGRERERTKPRAETLAQERSQGHAPAASGVASPASEQTPASDAKLSEVAKLERTWQIAAVSFLVVAIGAAAADRLHPAIAATFEARGTTPGTAVILRGAHLVHPVTATASAFGLTQISPVGPIEVPGRGGELLLRLRVTLGGCRQLVARIGGSCAGHPQPVSMPEQLGVTALSGELETRLEMTPASKARLGENKDEARLGPLREWSLAENARKTTLTLRCLRPVPLAVTRLPGHAYPTCSPDGRFFELALVNRKPSAPILALADSRTFHVVAAADAAEMTVDSGTLSFGDVQRRVHGIEPTTLALTGSDPIEMRLASPVSDGATATMLTSGETSSAAIEGEDAVPSLLARDSTVKSIVYGTVVTLLIGALTCYAVALMARMPKKG